MINSEILNTEMKKILIISLLLSLIALQCKAIDNIELTTTGEGKSIQHATNEALRSAIENADGIHLSSYTEYDQIDYDITLDEIKTVTSGVIQEYQIISSKMNERGNYVVTVHSLVSTTQHISDGKERGMICKFNGQSFMKKFLYALNQKQYQLQEERRELIDLVIREAKRENVEKQQLENSIKQQNSTFQSAQLAWANLLSQFRQDDYVGLTLKMGEPKKTSNDMIAISYSIKPHTTQAFNKYCSLIYNQLNKLQVPLGPYKVIAYDSRKQLSYQAPFPAVRLNKLLNETFSRDIYLEDNLGNRYVFEHIEFNPNNYYGFPWFRRDAHSDYWGFEGKYGIHEVNIPFKQFEGQLLIPYKNIDKITNFTASLYNNHKTCHIYHIVDDNAIKDTISTYMGENVCYHIKIPTNFRNDIDEVTVNPSIITIRLIKDGYVYSIKPPEVKLSKINNKTQDFYNLELVFTIPSLRVPANKNITMLIDLEYDMIRRSTLSGEHVSRSIPVEVLLYSPLIAQ